MRFQQRVVTAASIAALVASAGVGRAANPADFAVFSSPTVPGRLYVPPEASSGPRPLILFLHGAGETGSNNFNQINVNIDNLLAGAKARGAFLYAPQATTFTWADTARTAGVMAKIDEAISQFPVDASRLYVTGLSMGGGGVWNMLNRFPQRFAAGVPIAAVSPDFDFAGANLAGKPTWAFHARDDTTVSAVSSRQAVNAILTAAAATPLSFPATNETLTTLAYENDDISLNYSEWARGGHGIWGPVFNLPAMYDWMFSKSLAPALPIDPAANGQVTVNNTSPFFPIGDPSANAFPAGIGFVAVGSIDLTDAEVAQTNAASLPALASAFTQFGQSLPLGVNAVEGLFAANIGAPLDDDHPLVGRSIYVVAGDGADIASSDSLMVLKSNQAFANSATGFTTTIGLSNAVSTGTLLLGRTGSVFASRLGGLRNGVIAAAMVPEPSGLAGVALIWAMMAARRRRRA